MAAEDRGLQVVRVVDGRYELDEEALASVLLGDTADAPVAVVSVAGAYRGGKSFLLDYMLRYLQADPRSRADGSWVGGAQTPLTGFSWRGGSERETAGLVLWNQLLPIYTQDGQQVKVLLMDTQGAFDWSSSVRDCSTIFALSALLSSTLVYNLSRDIRADDLYHLQLFTEYGRLATENGGDAPFQTLEFLVRDWVNPHEHQYGSEGGRSLLQSRLRTMEGVGELTDLWSRIGEYFQDVSCFLMPYPGTGVHDPSYDGRLERLGNEFKESLVELVEHVMSPRSLKPRWLNGAPATARDLYHYINGYLQIFNSEELPPPTTILQATASAGLLARAEGSRRRYRRAMSAAGAAPAGRKPQAIRDAHRQALDSALSYFSEARLLADAEQVATTLRILQEEFENALAGYELSNEAKIQRGVSECISTYEEGLLNGVAVEDLCLHLQHLEDLHHTAKAAARGKFTTVRPGECDDGVLEILMTKIEEKLNMVRAVNERNNRRAVEMGVEHFKERMDSETEGRRACLHAQMLEELLRAARAAAEQRLRAARTAAYDMRHPDPHMRTLHSELTELQQLYRDTNDANNLQAIERAMNRYNEEMTNSMRNTIALPGFPIFDFICRIVIISLEEFQAIILFCAFVDIDMRARREAIEYFSNQRRPIGNYGNDVHLERLNRMLQARSSQLKNEVDAKAMVAIANIGLLAAAIYFPPLRALKH